MADAQAIPIIGASHSAGSAASTDMSKACSWWKYQSVKTNYTRGCREERRTNQFLGLQEDSVKKRFRY